MKKFLCLLFALSLLCVFTACENSKETASEKIPVTVNLPADNTVNGYRKDGASSKISMSDVTVQENTQSHVYCGNKNSKKFHKAGCSALNSTKDENKVYYQSRDEFISKGFEPCKMCNP